MADVNQSGWASNRSWGGEEREGLTVPGLVGAILSLLCLTGWAGNAYTLALMCRLPRPAASLRAHLVSLALADLLYLTSGPFVAYNGVARDWAFGQAGCRLLLTLDLLTMHASVFTLTAMSAERRAAVVSPLRARGRRRRLALLGLLWLLSLGLALPLMAAMRLEERALDDGETRRLCTPAWGEEEVKLYLTLLFGTSFLGPGLVLAYLYGGLARAYWRSETRAPVRRSPSLRVLGLVFTIVAAYWICFLPFWLWQLIPLYDARAATRLSFRAQGRVNELVTCLTYGNSCFNPFIYTLLTRSYRDYIRRARRGAPADGRGRTRPRGREEAATVRGPPRGGREGQAEGRAEDRDGAERPEGP
ncbi:urotensin-2 receptor-like [Chiloscyllium plagiosum]|uniref:urotensin-2 receptor-like n=1 Tax=Chiloscyllium plagiosum TaxID=36176 RepID=UPI001CB81226|nr:urotensin-2 receptor-like [Chiloscyllium plagiosum]